MATMDEQKIQEIGGKKYVNVEIKGEYQSALMKDPDDGVEREVMLHEYAYVMFSGYPIRANHMIAHEDNNVENNEFNNLVEIPQNFEAGLADPFERKNKIFQTDVLEKRKNFIKMHFPDVYQRLELDKKPKDRDYYIKWLNNRD